jgi:hypothetical protein
MNLIGLYGLNADWANSVVPKVPNPILGAGFMTHHHIKALAVCLLFGLAWTTSAYGTPGERFYVREDNTSVHERPTATASVVKHLNKGDRVIEFRRQGSWVKVSQLGAVGKDGWVEISRLAPEPPDDGEAVGEAPETGQVVGGIESLPNVTTKDIRRGECPVFDAGTIDDCFARFSRSLNGVIYGAPDCIKKSSSAILTMDIRASSEVLLQQHIPSFEVSVRRRPLQQWRAILSASKGGPTFRGCSNASRLNRSQAHSCRREILRSVTWRQICNP